MLTNGTQADHYHWRASVKYTAKDLQELREQRLARIAAAQQGVPKQVQSLLQGMQADGYTNRHKAFKVLKELTRLLKKDGYAIDL